MPSVSSIPPSLFVAGSFAAVLAASASALRAGAGTPHRENRCPDRRARRRGAGRRAAGLPRCGRRFVRCPRRGAEAARRHRRRRDRGLARRGAQPERRRLGLRDDLDPGGPERAAPRLPRRDPPQRRRDRGGGPVDDPALFPGSHRDLPWQRARGRGPARHRGRCLLRAEAPARDACGRHGGGWQLWRADVRGVRIARRREGGGALLRVAAERHERLQVHGRRQHRRRRR
jgi:hypothetical protein